MINKNPSESAQNDKKPTEQALLAEYQACQHDNSSTSLSYWTLAGIFIGISSVVLGWLLYALITGAGQNFPLLIVISVVGGAMIAILIFLKGWLKRVNYLADRNYERMREIELELGMWKSWRIHSLDKWREIRGKRIRCKRLKKIDSLFPNTNKMRAKLNKMRRKLWEEVEKGLSEEYLELLRQRQGNILELCNRYKPQRWYERRTRDLHFKGIFYAIISLWGFTIAIAWYLA